mmetsp:Transcript_133940/g.237090  ORF Transcript_133940/g.237090 Transcript_133940/m.237090 type:complete len:251 (-) Transcript_133940:12-764(-)
MAIAIPVPIDWLLPYLPPWEMPPLHAACRSMDEILIDSAARMRICEPYGLGHLAKASPSLEHLALHASTMSLRSTLFFEFGKSVLLEESMSVLEEWAECIMKFKWLRVHIVGHCGLDVPDPLCFSRQRARWVRDHLLHLGVSRHRMKVFGRGNREPFSQRTGRQAVENRRAEVYACAADGSLFPPMVVVSHVECEWPPAAERCRLAPKHATAKRACFSRFVSQLLECPRRISGKTAALSSTMDGVSLKRD